jgi:hypothetical protein
MPDAPAATKSVQTKISDSKPRRHVYSIEAVRSGRGVDVVFDLGETLLTMTEEKFFDSLQGPAYLRDGRGRDVWIFLSGEWRPFYVSDACWMQYAQTRQRIRQEDFDALAEAMRAALEAETKEGEIVSETEGSDHPEVQ